MKFSRNPITGTLEAYTDEGIYVGNMATMNVDTELTAQDGGPGSGNFGHKGRPGLVGGSGPGGGKGSGKLYRHEKEGVGFFGTKRDWLNGLEGEEQHKAARFIAQKKKDMKEAFGKKDKIKDLYLKGYLTLNEFEEKEKELGIKDLTEKSPVEQFILQKGDKMDVHTLLSYADNARNWAENGKELKNRNLTEEEQKLFDYTWNKEEFKPIFSNLHAKALGLPTDKIDIPEELYYESGARERPKPPEGKPDYGWYAEKRNKVASSLEGYIGNVIDIPMWARTQQTPEQFAEINKKFVDYMKYDRLSPMKCREALKAMREMRLLMTVKKDDRHGYYYESGELNITPEMVSRLSNEEQRRLLDMANRALGNGFSPEDKFKKIEDISHEDFSTMERNLDAMALRTKDEQNYIRDYVTLMDKLLTGEVPSEDNPVERRKKDKKEEEARIRQEWLDKRDEENKEFRNSGKAVAKQQSIKKIRAITKDSVANLSASECSKLARESGIIREGSDFVTSPLIPDEFYRSAVLAYRNVIDKFPFLAGEFGGFGSAYVNCSSGTLAGCCKDSFDSNNGEILLNYSKFRSTQALKSLKESTGNWWVQADKDLPDGYTDFTHEIGHALANWLHRYTYGGFKGVPKNGGAKWLGYYYDNEVATLLKKRTLKACGISSYEEIKNEVSEYAASSRLNKGPEQVKGGTIADEFFAECFCELMCSSKPRRVAVEFGKQLEKFIKDNKISEMTTCNTEASKPQFIET